MAGRKVVILPDNDDDGKKYAQNVTSAVLNLKKPARVKIVELPDLPTKGDCVDWLQGRNGQSREDTVRQLKAFVRAAPEETQLPKAALTEVGAMKNLDDYYDNMAATPRCLSTDTAQSCATFMLHRIVVHLGRQQVAA
jgi:DNA primase